MDMNEDEINIIRACKRVNDQLFGCNFPEKYYETALNYELRVYFNSVQSQYDMSCYYTTSENKKIQIGHANKIDILIDDRIILELKKNHLYKRTQKECVCQCAKYLRFMEADVCYLVIFGSENKNDFVIKSYDKNGSSRVVYSAKPTVEVIKTSRATQTENEEPVKNCITGELNIS